jgi:hypothetical protein
MKLHSVALAFTLTLTSSFAHAQGGGGSSGGSTGGTTTGLANPSQRSPSNGEVRNALSPPPGTNSLGTAQSSGPPGGGALRSNGTRMPGPDAPTKTSNQDSDARIEAENRRLDNAVKSICRGC